MKGQATIYWRERGGVQRAYADLRAYADVGGRREALVPKEEKLATTDPAIAQQLLAARITELDARRRGRALHGESEPAGLAVYARDHLVKKEQAGEVTEQSLAASQLHLERAVECFGADREIASLTVPDVSRWIAWLKDKGQSGDTIRHHLNSLSNMYVRAGAEGRVTLGYNPVTAMPRKMKPKVAHREAEWLEVPEAALLLEAARTLRIADRRDWCSVPFTHELIATWLLTGGRPSEVTGLEVDDVSLERETVTFRPNAHRRLKTLTSSRVVRLWPQLAEILKAYFPRREAMGQGTLLFPSFRTGKESRLTKPGRILARVAARIGRDLSEVYVLRHSYCAARLQTLDAGAPVSPYTVGRELGHGGDQLVKKVYGHLGNVRQRSDVVEYRVEQYAAKLGDRLKALQPSAV